MAFQAVNMKEEANICRLRSDRQDPEAEALGAADPRPREEVICSNIKVRPIAA